MSKLLINDPVFCFTADIDWAPEWAIAEMMDYFGKNKIPLTPFVTHHSGTVAKYFNSMKEKVGLHPNFLPSSTHGNSIKDVINHVTKLWPESVSFRSHSFFDHTHITDEFKSRGFRYDSNLCLFLQSNCVPLRHRSGLLRFPVFWEDQAHFTKGLSFTLSLLQPHLETPGLKIFDIHPIHFALNTPSEQFYVLHKSQPTGRDRWSGDGIQTLVESVVRLVKEKNYRCSYLHDLYLEASQEHLKLYESASRNERAEMVRTRYERLDSQDIYATSRDFNLRELEIQFITKNCEGEKVLDVGCGNGYTLLRLAQLRTGKYVGVDFSPNMIQGARVLTGKLRPGLRSVPDYRLGNVLHLPFDRAEFDCAISERCVLNLSSREDQEQAIQEIHRVLKPGGIYLMVEGTEDGLGRLNLLRTKLGLAPIPTVDSDNISSLKFREIEIEEFLEPFFRIETRQYWGTYYLISRVVHPLLVHPKEPRFDAAINTIARKVAEVLPDTGRLGHVVGYKLVKRQ